jgi:hypothetical protein
MGVAILIILFVVVIRFLPGILGLFGDLKRDGEHPQLNVIEKIFWPFLVIGEFIASAGSSLFASLKGLLRLSYRQAGTGEPVAQGGNLVGKLIGSMRKNSRLPVFRNLSPNRTVRYLYTKILARGHKLGIRRIPSETPSEFAPKLSNPKEITLNVTNFTKLYEASRYGSKKPDTGILALAKALAEDIIRKLRA